MTDQDRILAAVGEAQRILAAYIEPGPRDPEATINELLSVMDHRDVVEAFGRLHGDEIWERRHASA